MIFDLNQLHPSSIVKKYDVCICGAGPAGITIARKLAQQGKMVALFEGGGFEFTEQSQDAYAGKSIGMQYYEGLQYNRLRFLGGTSNHWAGRCSFFDDVDFEQRSYLGMPGWPIQREEVLKHFDEAAEILDISREGFAKTQDMHWSGANFRKSDYTLSTPTRFASKYHDELKKSSQIDVYVNANLVDIQLNSALDTVVHYELMNYKKQKFIFTGTQYVLALGAIENARLLLNCNKQIVTGLGNQSDMVGRCFMEHLNIQLGRFVANHSDVWKSGGFDLNPRSEFIRKLNIGNSVISFGINNGIVSYGRLASFKTALKEMLCQSASLSDFSRKISDFNCTGDGVISTLMEQAPNRNSRVKLGNDKDYFGLRRVILDWQLAEQDYKTIHVLGVEVAKEMAKTGLARVNVHDAILTNSNKLPEVGAHAHHLGTTRMADNPKHGVVDQDSKLHGTKNMYIAGSSVFSTGGGCNPTFTITMLALKLANHLS